MSAIKFQKSKVMHLMQELSKVQSCCPAHSIGFSQLKSNTSNTIGETPEYAFEMACSNIRFGRGVTREVGMDLANIGSKRVLLITDNNIAKLPILSKVTDSLSKHKVDFQVFTEVAVEPTDQSVFAAVQYALSSSHNGTSSGFDSLLAVGGGSVMDTCKVVNLLTSLPELHQASPEKEVLQDSLLRFVNAPIGRGEPVRHSLKPLFAIPTTAGTGSETTGVAIFDIISMSAKTGIAHRNLRPTLGLIDPDHTRYLPSKVACYSGFDVFCHALESFTALPYHLRTPQPSNPLLRPAYQGSNPISDVWAKYAMTICAKFFRRAVKNADDDEARAGMHLASSCAGVGFGNAGVHLCHAMSYPISGMAKSHYRPPVTDYPKLTLPSTEQSHGFIPHGLAVILNAPAVFRFTASMCPDRHKEAAQLLKPHQDFSRIRAEDSGAVLADVILEYMSDLGIPNGLKAVGYSKADVHQLVEGVMPQHRITKLSPRPVFQDDIEELFDNSFTVY